MRLAFIILAYNNPEQLKRLISRLSHPKVDCYIHIDAKSDIAPFLPLAEQPQVYFLPKRTRVNWAGFGTVRATLDGLKVALEAERRYMSINLLSGACYPLVSMDELYTFYSQHRGQQFLDLFPDEEVRATSSKMERYHFVDIQFKGKYFLTNLFNRLMPRRKLPLGMRFYGGSAWWSITEECARFCLHFARQHPSVMQYFRYTWGCDEFVFQTLIMNDPAMRATVVPNNHRYIDWSTKGSHPKTFTNSDFPAIMQSGKFFARKFDMAKTPELMDKIDERILSYSGL
ncbi:beta-1,6-N-acetylglucosaminyltransferase [Chitinophaga vietnamensis]|uniref:beta-1,6-N-acetylglucosaminyltransferase n=1 Tax=Chitinophaga vietnamensis TaxID=2593957 RepID=UPI001177A0C7|nr:beta-1,6-N-acetylglucosaminyltransferase [Chitinophaga vietnamensis]